GFFPYPFRCSTRPTSPHSAIALGIPQGDWKGSGRRISDRDAAYRAGDAQGSINVEITDGNRVIHYKITIDKIEGEIGSYTRQGSRGFEGKFQRRGAGG